MNDRFLNRAEAADYVASKGLPCRVATLAKAVTRGGGPSYQKFGKACVYSIEALDAWIAARLTAPRFSSSGV